MSGVVRVKPKNPSNTHDISLSDGSRTWGIKLTDGPRAIQEISSQPSNIRITGGGEKYGDFDPSFSHIEMRDWTGGRGGERLVDDPSKFYDSLNAWTLTPGWWHQAPLVRYAEGVFLPSSQGSTTTMVFAENQLPAASLRQMSANVSWYAMLSTATYARSFVSSRAWGPDRGTVLVRRIGAPPSVLRYGFSAFNAGSSLSIISTALDLLGWTNISASDIEEGVASFAGSTMASGPSFASGSTGAVLINTTSAGTPANHWEFGYPQSSGLGADGYVCTAGASGLFSTGPGPYFRGSQTTTCRLTFFEMDRGLYLYANGLVRGKEHSFLINGWRGKFTAATTSALTDTAANWPTNIWAGARVAVIRGTGAGQNSAITSNSSTVLGVHLLSCAAANDEYVIYATDQWSSFAPYTTAAFETSSVPPLDHAVVGNVAYFAKGGNSPIAKLQWTGSSGHEWGGESSGNVADRLAFLEGSSLGSLVYRAVSSAGNLSQASTQGFSSAMTFSTTVIPAGNTANAFTNVLPHDGQVYAFKEDGAFRIPPSTQAYAERLGLGLDRLASSHTGRAAVSQNLYLYFGWSHSTQRLYQSAGSDTVDDMGLWKGTGLPGGRQGPPSGMTPLYSWLVQSVDAGSTGYSAVFIWNNQGWHEAWRLPVGRRLDSVFVQPCPGTRPRLWMSAQSDVMVMDLPENTLNPVNDGGIQYQPEGVLYTPTIDMGVSQIPKLFAELHVISRDLNSSGNEVRVSYQLDENIGSSNWTNAGILTHAPADSVPIMRGDKKAIRFRLQALTANSTAPTRVEAVVLKAVARTPVKRQWNIRARSGSFQVTQQGLSDADPDDFYAWLRKAAESASPIRMRAAWAGMDDIRVYAEYPTVLRQYTTPAGEWGADYNIVLREI